MIRQEIMETLEKQLQLLSERSKDCAEDDDLARISETMLEISRFLLDQNPVKKPYVPLK